MNPVRLTGPGLRWLALTLGVLAGCASPRVLMHPVHPTPPLLAPDHILAEDGMRLPLTLWRPQAEARAVVLALHGFNDRRAAFDELGEFLAARGVAVYAYDQRGFGATAGAGGWYGHARLIADVHLSLRLLRDRHPGLPLILAGESMGAAIALLSAIEPAAPAVDGLVLLAPAVWSRASMPWYQRGLLWLAAHTFPGATVSPRGLSIRPTDNEAALKKLREDAQVIKQTRVEALWGLADLMDAATAVTRLPPAPTLILYGARDEVIRRGPVCAWLAGLAHGPQHRLAVYPQGWHLLTRDLQAEVVLRDLSAWIGEPSAPLPSGAEQSLTAPALCSAGGA
ncbi:MAG: alpha/beta fold hydrolase [Burkholderiales bacterium]|nr:alpha/beta fold hydrolase [Burkholderiales bacterium]